jgi:hypothetical protein
MIPRAGVIVVLAASVGIMADLAVLQSQPAAAAQKSRAIYQSVYNGWKWWHVYCFRLGPTVESRIWFGRSRQGKLNEAKSVPLVARMLRL